MVAASNGRGAMATYAQRVIAAAPLIAESLYQKSPPRGGLELWHAFVRQLHLQDDRCQHDHTARRGATCWFGLLLLEKPHHRAVICLSCTGQPSQRISEARCTCLWWPPRWNSYGMESWDLKPASSRRSRKIELPEAFKPRRYSDGFWVFLVQCSGRHKSGGRNAWKLVLGGLPCIKRCCTQYAREIVKCSLTFPNDILIRVKIPCPTIPVKRFQDLWAKLPRCFYKLIWVPGSINSHCFR